MFPGRPTSDINARVSCINFSFCIYRSNSLKNKIIKEKYIKIFTKWYRYISRNILDFFEIENEYDQSNMLLYLILPCEVWVQNTNANLK